MSGKKKQRDIIDEVIETVDDPIHGWKPLSIGERLKLRFDKIIVMAFVILLTIYILVALREQPFVTFPIIVSASAFLVAVYNILYVLREVDRKEIKRVTVDWNYKRIKEGVKSENRFLLKALIHMRTFHEDFKLSEVRKKHPSLFNKENLVGMLYNMSPISIGTHREKNTEGNTEPKEENEKPNNDSLIAEYQVLNEAIWRRDQVSLLVNSIMISATLGVVTFAIRFRDELGIGIHTGLSTAGFLPLASLILIVIPYILWVTSRRLDKICFDRIHKIEDILHIEGHHSIFEQIECSTWYKFRHHMWHFVFLLFIGVYIFTTYWLFR